MCVSDNSRQKSQRPRNLTYATPISQSSWLSLFIASDISKDASVQNSRDLLLRNDKSVVFEIMRVKSRLSTFVGAVLIGMQKTLIRLQEIRGRDYDSAAQKPLLRFLHSSDQLEDYYPT